MGTIITAIHTGISSAETESALTFSEPTVPDLRLGEALGYERHADIRELIKRHAEALETIGVLRTVRKTSGANGGRPTTEYHLNRAQTAYIVGKAKTKRAVSMAVLMAEVVAMFTEGRLVAVDQAAADELQAAGARERERRRLIHEEDKQARYTALKMLNSGRRRRR